jgi:cytochrome c553
MPYSRALFPAAGLALALLTPGCGSPPAPTNEQAAPAAIANTPEHMQEHFTRLRDIEEAIIRADLEAARVPARWLADHPIATDFPRETARPLSNMLADAEAVATTGDIHDAAMAAGSLAARCGSCHAAAKVEPELPAAPEHTAATPATRHMVEHQAALHLMARGLVAPISGEWRTGADALKDASPSEKDRRGMSEEALAAETRIHELAGKAIDAPDQRTRAEIYGSIIASCADCHRGSGGGPGASKN